MPQRPFCTPSHVRKVLLYNERGGSVSEWRASHGPAGVALDLLGKTMGMFKDDGELPIQHV
jgi:hypothetical protein